MKTGTVVKFDGNRKTGVVLATQGDTIIVKSGDRKFYLRRNDVRVIEE